MRDGTWRTERLRPVMAATIALALAGVATLPASSAAAQDGAACPDDNPPAPFTDRAEIPPTHRANVDCAANTGITDGFADGTYRPTHRVRRDQMAAFIARVVDAAGAPLPSAGDQGFTDIGGNTHADDINRLAAAGVVMGTSATTYSPGALVRRDQIASFVLRAVAHAQGVELSEHQSEEDRFTDVAAGNAHRPNINGAAALGLAHGRTATTFDPAAPTRRDQMASFLVRTLAFLQGVDLTALTLRGDGLGAGLFFETPMGAAMERLTDELGEPDEDSGWQTYCELAGPEEARTLTWADSLRVTFLHRAAPALEAYSSTPTADGTDPLGLRTPLGLGLHDPSSDVDALYGERATFASSDTNPFGSFWTVEPAEGGDQVVFVDGDDPSDPVVMIGGNVLFCE